MKRSYSVARHLNARYFALATTLVTTALAGIFISSQSHAAEEIVVTARKRAETVRDVPATVDVYSAERIERSNINTASKIALITPGVSLVDAAEVGDTQVNIRGMNGARDAENSYALVIDGITMTNPAALNREYSNLAQIEVLKGPQGAIYGRNASAGAFIINTQDPGEEFGGQIKGSFGQDDTYSLIGDIHGPLADRIRGSLQGEYFSTDGFYTNEFLNRDDIVDNKELWAVTGRLLFDIDDATELDVKLRYGEVDAASITFNSVFNIADLSGPGGLGPAAFENVNEHEFRYYSNIVHTNDQEALEFSVKLERELDGFDLTAWTLYSDIENQLGADGTSAAFGFFAADPACMSSTMGLSGFPLNAPQFIGSSPESAVLNPMGSLFGAYTPTTCDGTQFQRRNQEDLSFEIRLTSNDDDPFQWMTGLYFLEIEREVAVGTGIDRRNPAGNFRGAEVVQQPFSTKVRNPTEQLVWDEFDTSVWSVFGQIGYDFTDTVTGDIALRYDREERKVKSLVPTADIVNPQFINPCIPFAPTDGMTPINPGLCADPFTPIAPKERTFSHFQPKFSLKWDATENTTYFTSWGIGFRSGGFNNQGSAATVDTFINNLIPNICDPSVAGCVESGRSRVSIRDDYGKETTSAFELGFKSELADNAVQLEGAFYYTDVDDMQFFEFVVGPFGLLRLVENIDEVEIRGAEFGVTWDAAEWVDLNFGANVTRSKITKNNVRPDTVGNDSPYTPEYTINAGAAFQAPIGDNLTFFANLDVSAIGPTWFHVVQDQTRPIGFELLIPGIVGGSYSAAERDSYVLTNARVGIEGRSWTAAIWVDNLTDEDYLEEVIPAPEFGGSFIHAGTERRVGADVTYRF